MVGSDGPVAARVAVAAPVGLVAAGLAAGFGGWQLAPAVGWTAAAVIYAGWTWLVVLQMDAARTAEHATREDPTRPMTDVIVLLACVASLAGVGYLLVASSGTGLSAALSAAVGIASVASAWFVVHTVFTLRYALLYYAGGKGGITFNQHEDPSYLDFAYLAFTLGMTYQVSDTNLGTRTIRATALRHALLSYLLGAVILATTINLIGGLTSLSG